MKKRKMYACYGFQTYERGDGWKLVVFGIAETKGWTQYVLAHDYDLDSDSWAYGNYFTNLDAALNQFSNEMEKLREKEKEEPSEEEFFE
jgi:hypothetical protein